TSFITAMLSATSHTITAVYTDTPPDARYAPSAEVTLNGIVVTPAPTTITGVTASPATGIALFGQTVTLTATVNSSVAGIPQAGSVTFWDGAVGTGTNLGTGPIDPTTGKASITTAVLTAATHTIRAVYADTLPDINYSASPVASLSGYVVGPAGTTITTV